MTDEENLIKHGYEKRPVKADPEHNLNYTHVWWRKGNYIGITYVAIRHLVRLIAEINAAKMLLRNEGYLVHDPGDWPSHHLQRIDAIIEEGSRHE
jgi:hypothetical protein